MPFQPSTNIYIGTVPFDPSYRHVRYFSDREAQQQYFAALCPMSLRREDYTYQRVDDSIVVPFNAETLYGYNYCMFKNENYGERWFYSFITDVEYVNPNSSRLHLSLDIMQTWFPDCTVKACPVEREHVNDDSIGAHIKDEGLSTGELKCVYTAYDQSSLYTVVASAVEPLQDGNYVNNGGDVYLNVASGVSLTAFDMKVNRGDFVKFMDALSSNGQQDAIASIHMVPATTIPGFAEKTNGWGTWIDGSGTARQDVLTWNLGFDTLDGYRPKNNKMYCYPFEYAEISNLSGMNQQLRLEFFDEKGTVAVRRTGGVDASSQTIYIPLGYNGYSEFYEGAVALPAYPTCSWVYQAWANMEGRAKFEYELPDLLSDFEGNTIIDGGSIQSNSLTQLPYGMNFLDNISRLNFIGLGTGALETAANLSKLQRTPNTQRGGTNSSTALANIDAFKLAVRKYTCRAEIAKQIDDFLSAYGYLVSETKVPNVVGRRSWNYVKTNGASVVGKVPAGTLAQINRLFDRGITFWHVNDVGNYALDNSIV